MRIQATSGQSKGSVFIAMMGKTTDFLGNYILVLPVQYVIMTYFSSSVAYINGLQVLWYYERDKARLTDSIIVEPRDNSLSTLDDFGDSRKNLFVYPHAQCTVSVLVRLILGCVLCLLLAACLAGLVWNFGLLGLIFPGAILGVVCATYVTRSLTWAKCCQFK